MLEWRMGYFNLRFEPLMDFTSPLSLYECMILYV